MKVIRVEKDTDGVSRLEVSEQNAVDAAEYVYVKESDLRELFGAYKMLLRLLHDITSAVSARAHR